VIVSVTQHSRSEKQNLIEDNSTLLKGSHTIGCPLKDCGWWPAAPLGGTPRPGFEPKASGSGSQRGPLLTIMNANGGPMLS
jgi:hypothetical protein